MRPSLLTEDLFKLAAFFVACYFILALVILFLMRHYYTLIRKTPKPLSWLLLIPLLFAPMIIPVFGILYPLISIPAFLVVLAAKALKGGERREFAILICAAVVASVTFGSYVAYTNHYKQARWDAAWRGKPFPEDVTPVPQFDASTGIPYQGAGALPEFEEIVDDALHIRIPIEKGFVFEETANKEDFISFTMTKPRSPRQDGVVYMQISISVRKKPTAVPSITEYIEKTYADMDRDDVISPWHAGNNELQRKLRKIVYGMRNELVIFQSRVEAVESKHARRESASYLVRGQAMMFDAIAHFEIRSFEHGFAQDPVTQKHVTDWAYAFIETNRETAVYAIPAPDAPATGTAPEPAPPPSR